MAHRTVVEDYSLSLKMTTAQVVETSVTVNNSHIQDYVHPDDYTQPTYEQINISLCIVRLRISFLKVKVTNKKPY